MNRTIFSILNLKFNPTRNNWVGKISKKKCTTAKSKNYKNIIVRKFSSFNQKQSSSPQSSPPPSMWETFVIACFIYYLNCKNPPPNGTSLISNNLH